MKKIRMFAATAFLAALSACVSAPESLRFDGKPNRAMLVLSTSLDDALQFFFFRRVDLESGKFVEGSIDIPIDNNTQAFLWDGVPNQINHGDPRRSVVLAVHEIASGHYVLVEAVSANPGWSVIERKWVCLFEGAPVYHIGGGETSIIRVDNLFARRVRPTDSGIMDEYSKAIVAYPGLQKNAQIRAPTALIQWQETEPSGLFKARNCAEPETFTIVAQQPPNKPVAISTPAVTRELPE